MKLIRIRKQEIKEQRGERERERERDVRDTKVETDFESLEVVWVTFCIVQDIYFAFRQRKPANPQ